MLAVFAAGKTGPKRFRMEIISNSLDFHFIFCSLFSLLAFITTLLEKGFRKGSLAVPIGEPYLVPGRTCFGFRYNYFGFHVEPFVERVLPGTKRVLPGTNKGSLMGQPKNPFRF